MAYGSELRRVHRHEPHVVLIGSELRRVHRHEPHVVHGSEGWTLSEPIYWKKVSLIFYFMLSLCWTRLRLDLQARYDIKKIAIL